MILALLMSLPLCMSLRAHLAGSGGDPWQTMWRFDSKAELNSPGDDFFGGGEPRLVNLSVWPWMGVHVLFGQPLAYNIIWLTSFVLSGFDMYLLVRYLFRREAPAFLAGMYYMFLPYHVAHSYGHFGAMQAQWLPLIILTLFVWVKRPNIWKTLILAALLTVQAWSEHHYMLWLMLFVGLWILFYWKRVRSFWLKKQGNKYVAVLAVLLLFFVVLPYLPTIKLSAQPDGGLELGQEQTVRFSADLFSYLVPASFHTIWGKAAGALFTTSFTGNVTEATHYLGLVPLLLVLFLHKAIPAKQKRFWLVVAIFFLLISLGPRLHILGRVMNLPLPYAVVDGWPVFSAVRAVARASVMVGLTGAVLLGGVLAAQLRRRKGTIAVASLLLLEFLFMPMPLQSTQLPEVYKAVRESAGSGLIEIPAATNYTAASRALYASSSHGKKVLGNIALERAEMPDSFAQVHTLPALRQLLYLRTTALQENRQEFFDQDLDETLPDVLNFLDAPNILVHTDSLSQVQQKAVRHLLEDLMGLKAREYSDALLYTIENMEQKSDGVFLSRDERWQNVGFDARRDSVFAEINHDASVTLYNVTQEEKKVTLSFSFAPESHGNMSIKRAGTEIVRYSSRGGQRETLMIVLPPGEATISFENLLDDKVILQNPEMQVP